jgi:hypothetical protein
MRRWAAATKPMQPPGLEQQDNALSAARCT